jgi:hypothetical protein
VEKIENILNYDDMTIFWNRVKSLDGHIILTRTIEGSTHKDAFNPNIFLLLMDVQVYWLIQVFGL